MYDTIQRVMFLIVSVGKIGYGVDPIKLWTPVFKYAHWSCFAPIIVCNSVFSCHECGQLPRLYTSLTSDYYFPAMWCILTAINHSGKTLHSIIGQKFPRIDFRNLTLPRNGVNPIDVVENLHVKHFSDDIRGNIILNQLIGFIAKKVRTLRRARQFFLQFY